jgi:hypothetical protein
MGYCHSFMESRNKVSVVRLWLSPQSSKSPAFSLGTFIFNKGVNKWNAILTEKEGVK